MNCIRYNSIRLFSPHQQNFGMNFMKVFSNWLIETDFFFIKRKLTSTGIVFLYEQNILHAF